MFSLSIRVIREELASGGAPPARWSGRAADAALAAYPFTVASVAQPRRYGVPITFAVLIVATVGFLLNIAGHGGAMSAVGATICLLAVPVGVVGLVLLGIDYTRRRPPPPPPPGVRRP